MQIVTPPSNCTNIYPQLHYNIGTVSKSTITTYRPRTIIGQQSGVGNLKMIHEVVFVFTWASITSLVVDSPVFAQIGLAEEGVVVAEGSSRGKTHAVVAAGGDSGKRAAAE